MAKILMVTSEAAPFAKTGGLADVLAALPPALAKLGEEVVVLLPRYASCDIPEATRIWREMPLTLGRHSFMAAIDEVRVGGVGVSGVRYFFVDCPPLYGRAGIYGERGADYHDNHVRYGILNQAALAVARYIFRPDIFHGHDWPAGLLGPYLREMFHGDPTFFGTKFVLTIHNLGYQGTFPQGVLTDIGLDPKLFHSEGLEFWNQVNFLKAGIVWADAITTVSPTYAKEIQTAEYGHGLEGLLQPRAERVYGILNGVDYESWNPETDAYLPSRYSSAKLDGKRITKLALLKEMGFPGDERRPLIGVVSRFVGQKGFDLLVEIAPRLTEMDLALVALGSGEPELEEMFLALALEHPTKFAVRIGYDNALAHRIEGASDMFLMPSRYEPCGLNQMYSLRYGTVPLVRATGGLEDSVDETTGFKFQAYTPAALLACIQRALVAWKNKEAWRARMRKGMSKNFSWDVAAVEYQKLYRGLAT